MDETLMDQLRLLRSTSSGSDSILRQASALEESILDEGRALLAKAATRLVEGGGETNLPQLLAMFDSAIAKAPSLKAYAWERGFVLYYMGEYRAAADQFSASAAVDEDDVEPVLWRFMCEARIQGWKMAQQTLHTFRGHDRRLCMMQLLHFFMGEGSPVEEVLAHASGDCHSAARASFACALFYEAKGEESMSLPLLYAAADLDCGTDSYMISLARVHLQQLRRRLAAQGVLPHVTAGPLTDTILSKRLNASNVRGTVVSPLSQSC